jgi:SMODS and SLOG-associating 2TM effector domain
MDSHSAVSANHPSTGSALTGASTPAGDGSPHPKWEWAASRIRQRRDLCDQRAQAHDARAVFWQQWAAPLAWIAAVFAALSALSVVANITLAATALSILTAIITATIAAFQPSEAAKSHRAAATAYERLARKFDDVEALDLGDSKQQIPADKIDPVRTEITKLEEELNSIELSHPPVSSYQRHAYPYMSAADEHYPRRTVNSR